MSSKDKDPAIGANYAVGQLAKAFVTSVTGKDEGTRRRAKERARQWLAVLAGTASGELAVGSRIPLRGLPAWVTPQVLRGGFATTTPAAGGPLRPHEVALADRVGVAAQRGALFAWYLSDAGLDELWALLDSGGYRVELPEQAALLAVAWLLRAGDRVRALGLLDEISAYTGRLCFTPVPDSKAAWDLSVVWREPAGAAASTLRSRQENARVEAMREALTVWNPFADELLSLWLDTRDADGRVAATFPPGWLGRAEELLARYERLAAEHTRCGKHRRRRENLAILRTALQETVNGAGLTPRTVVCCGALSSPWWPVAAVRARPTTSRCALFRPGSPRCLATTCWLGSW
jgi:hypothetical protein